MIRGEVHLAPFLYSDLQGSKRRPVCVISSDAYHEGPDVIVAMVTSSRVRIEAPALGDVVVDDWEAAGLLRPSVVRAGRLLVLEAGFLDGPLGVLTDRDRGATDDALRSVLGLG